VLTVARHVGRLIEIRGFGNPTEDDIARFRADAVAVLSTCVAETKRPAVACVDGRTANLIRPAAADLLIDLMRRDNRNVEKSAFLSASSAVFALQMSRFLRESDSNTRRRLFTEVEPLLAWMQDVLTPEESIRLRRFLGEIDVESFPTPSTVPPRRSSSIPPPRVNEPSPPTASTRPPGSLPRSVPPSPAEPTDPSRRSPASRRALKPR
jgi:hypothetical protein